MSYRRVGTEKMVKTYHMPRTCQSALLVLQLISTFERQIFDFLGYMWLPILGNFFNIIFVIFGLFGLYQYRTPYMLAYSVWTLVWIAYNVFIVCFYLEVGDLDKKEDVLSFGAGSFSWWLINSPGCRPMYNSSVPDQNSDVPPRPSAVEGCYVRYEKIEVTHAAIQLVISTLGFILSIIIIHYFVTVVGPKNEKQGVKAMYSIEYSPQRHDSNPNSLERETDLQLDNGDLRSHMTPRRVKRRSYRNSTRNTKSMNRQSNRQSGRSARSSGRSHKSINPVTRLIDADQNRADSSTSNEPDRYGQINPGFQTDTSRPNSIYNLSGPPTDIEAARPPSALTSYSNFHGQRRPTGPSGPAARSNVTNLTQESLLNHDQNLNMDASYDDLPPPPPPLSSSPTPQEAVSDSDNTSSVATAQLPVPQTRGSVRRNEYVNIPIPKEPSPEPAIISHQEPEPQSPVSPTPPSSSGSVAPPPVPPHNYANIPDTRSMAFNGARPRTTNPLYNKLEPDTSNMEKSLNGTRYSELDRSTGPLVSYEAETLRADTKLVQQGLYNDPYSLSDAPSQRSSHSEPYPSSPRDIYILPSGNQEPQYGQKPLPQSPRGQAAVDRPRGQVPAPPERYTNMDRFKERKHPDQMVNQLTQDYVKQQQQIMPGEHSGHLANGQLANNNNGQRENLKRVPNGHMARDRASLRAKQRRDMENKASKQKSGHNYVNTNAPEYNFPPPVGSTNGPMSLQNGHLSGPAAPTGPTSLPGYTEAEDKWYMKDSMRPVGASSHGANCKCYRCQRKLTAI